MFGSVGDAGRHRDRLAAREQAVRAEIEADDPVDPLDAELDGAAVDRDRLGVVPAARRSGLPSGPSTGAISASAMPMGVSPS